MRWYVLAILFLAYVCNVADRLILSILAQHIKADLHLRDWEIGLLIGPAVAFFYAILGLPMGYLADRVNRVRFLSVCLAMWSLLTAMGGLAGNAIQLGLARIGVSAVEAGGSPASSSILADYFPPRLRPTAMGIYGSASTIGVAVSFALGGWLNAEIGWRWTLVAAGAPGLVLALLMILTVREPRRGAQDGAAFNHAHRTDPPGSMLATLKTLWAIPYFRLIMFATGLSNFGAHAVINWGPSLVMRKFYAGSNHAGLSLGLGIALCGAGAMVIGGRVITHCATHGLGKPLRIATVLQLLTVPLMLGALFVPDLRICVLLLCLTYGALSFFIPIYWSVTQSHVPPEMRAMAAAMMLLTIAIIGAGISAPLVGGLSDLLEPSFGNASLQYAMAIGTIVNLATALLFWRAARTAPLIE